MMSRKRVSTDQASDGVAGIRQTHARKIARAWGVALAGLLRERPAIRSGVAEQVAGGPVPDCAWTALFASKDGSARLQLGLSRQLIDCSLDLFFGGAGQGSNQHDDGLSPMEVRMARHIASALCDSGPLHELHDIDRESLSEGEEELIGGDRLSFAVVIGTIEIGHIWLVLSSSETLGKPARASDAQAAGTPWHPALAHAAADISVDARAVLMEPVVGLERLLGLAVGDILPGTPAGAVQLLVEGRPVALGSIGVQSGHRALKIDTVDRGATAQ